MTDISKLSDDEFEQLLAHSQQSPNAIAATHQSSGLPSDDYYNPHDPTEDMGTIERLRAGIGRGMSNVVRHAGNLVGLESDQDLAEANRLDKALLHTPSGKIGNAIGETAPLVPFSMAATAGLGALGKFGAALASNPISNGAFQGVLQGGLMADPGHKGTGMLLGGVTGAAIPVAIEGGKKLINGIDRTPEAQQLLDQGVRLTPGQMNPEGVWNKIEENVRGFPAVGNLVEKARGQAQGDFQRGVIQEASAPGYKLQSTSTDPNELYTEAYQSYKPLYDAAKGFPVKPEIVNQGANQSLDDLFKSAANQKGVGATAATREQAQDFLEGQLQAIKDQAKSAGGMTSDHLIQLRSNINEEMRGAGFDNAGKTYSKLLGKARDQITNALDSQLPKEASQALKTANDAYPKLAIIKDAIKRGGDQPSGFTPAQLSQAVKSATETNTYAQGGGLMRDWSSAGRDIFTQRNPHTGSALATGAVLGTAATHAPAVVIPGSLAALGLVGTDAGRNFISGQTGWQQGSQALIKKLMESSSPEARALAGNVSRTALSRALLNHSSVRAALTNDTGNP